MVIDLNDSVFDVNFCNFNYLVSNDYRTIILDFGCLVFASFYLNTHLVFMCYDVVHTLKFSLKGFQNLALFAVQELLL
jgi:hypothetical protein